MSNWCWVACAIMVGVYDTSSTITQQQVVHQVKGSVVNDAGSGAEEAKAINKAGTQIGSCFGRYWATVTY